MSMLFKRIKDWVTSITGFRTGDVIPVDGPSGTAKMSKDDLLALTAQNAYNSKKFKEHFNSVDSLFGLSEACGDAFISVDETATFDNIIFENASYKAYNSHFTNKVYRVFEGDIVRVRGYGRGGTDVQLIGFYQSSELEQNQFVSYGETLGFGEDAYVDKVFVIPYGMNINYCAISINDAQSTGEGLSLQVCRKSCKQTISELLNDGIVSIPVESISSGIMNTDKTITPSSYFRILYVRVDKYSKLNLRGYFRNGTTAYGYCFLTDDLFNNDNFVSGVVGTGDTSSYNSIVDVPDGAVYLAISVNIYMQQVADNPIRAYSYRQKAYSVYNGINYSETTFTGMCSWTLRKIQEKYPNSRVVVCTPLNNGYYPNVPKFFETNGIGKQLIDYVNRIKECAGLWGIPIIDLNHDVGLNPLLSEHRNTYYSNVSLDNLHPNTAGHKLIANVIIDALKNVIAPFGNYSTWSGKKALFIGDSITSNQGGHTSEIYFEIVKTELGLSVATNGGKSGTGYSRKTPMTPCILDRLSDYSNDYDLVVIFVGVNDFFGNNGEPAEFGEVYT